MYINLISRLSIDYQIRGTPTKTLFRWLLSIWPVCYVGCVVFYMLRYYMVWSFCIPSYRLPFYV